MVPTKWSITAVDDTIGKSISLKEIPDLKEHEYAALFGGYMGNYYIALIFPGPWSFELFETYVGGGLSNSNLFESAQDYEGAIGRKDYAQNTVGGYYASRLAILEHFQRTKTKGRVLLLRFITDEYIAPLGVWVVREATRKCLNSKPIYFGSKELLLKYGEVFISRKYNLNTKVIYNKSWLLKDMKIQPRLSEF